MYDNLSREVLEVLFLDKIDNDCAQFNLIQYVLVFIKEQCFFFFF